MIVEIEPSLIYPSFEFSVFTSVCLCCFFFARLLPFSCLPFSLSSLYYYLEAFFCSALLRLLRSLLYMSSNQQT